jgi:hypothetical protein
MPFRPLPPPGHSLRLTGDTAQCRKNREAYIQANNLLGEARGYMKQVALAHRQQQSTDPANRPHYRLTGRNLADTYQEITQGYGQAAAKQFSQLRQLLKTTPNPPVRVKD